MPKALNFLWQRAEKAQPAQGNRDVPLTAQGIAGPRGDLPAGAGVAAPPGAFTPAGPPPDPELTLRIKRAYRLAAHASRGPGNSMWADIVRRNAAIHEALLADDDRLEKNLRNPSQSDLFYGFHSLFASRTVELRAAGAEQRQAASNALFREFCRLCEALGVRRIPNPEAKADNRASNLAAADDLEASLRELDGVLGMRVEFPNPYGDEFGIPTSRGIASYRPIHALYQAFRLRQLAGIHGPRILEIGAGLGRTMGYAHAISLRQCTIVDLPMTNVAQASFLGQSLGPGAVTLLGEEPRSGSIRIVTPEWLRACGETFDIVLNVDSMTEMDRRFADEYAAFIKANAKCFLSINHDANSFRVCDLVPLKSMVAQRFPYWMREGYTEEIYIQPDLAGTRPA